jgi:polar amino acid transport system permease protein
MASRHVDPPVMGSPPPEASSPPPIKAIPVRHPGRWVAAVLLFVLAVALVRSAVTNGNYEWDVVGRYLFDDAIMKGLVATLELTVIAMVIGIVVGILLAVMRLSPNPLVAGGASAYIWFFRGTPVLVQLLFWTFLSALYPTISIGIPFGPTFFHVSGQLPLFAAAILGLGLNEGAYMAEIVRAGILSVDAGQTEAAHALGMTRLQTLRRIVLPQAMRVIVPPTGNETISMLKTTSIVSVIAFQELLYSAQIIYSRTYEQIPLLIVACIWYLVITTVLSVGQYYLERRFGRGHYAPTPILERWFKGVRTRGGTREES